MCLQSWIKLSGRCGRHESTAVQFPMKCLVSFSVAPIYRLYIMEYIVFSIQRGSE